MTNQSEAVSLPTEAMIEAGAKAFCETQSLNPRKLAAVVFDAMTAARPQGEPSEATQRMAKILGAEWVPNEADTPTDTGDGAVERADRRSSAWSFFDGLDGPIKEAFDGLGDNDKAETVDQLEDALAALATPPDPNKGLVEALRPFAKACDDCVNDEPDNGEIWEHGVGMEITFADLRRAAAALKSVDPSNATK